MPPDETWLPCDAWSTIGDSMTLVAMAHCTDGSVIVSDSRETRHTPDGPVYIDVSKKVYALPSGGLMGVAGVTGIGDVLLSLIDAAPTALDACRSAYAYAEQTPKCQPFSILVSKYGEGAILPYKDRQWLPPMPVMRSYSTIGLDLVSLAFLRRFWNRNFNVQQAAALCCVSVEMSKIIGVVGGDLQIVVDAGDEEKSSRIETESRAAAARWMEEMTLRDWGVP